MSIYVKIARTPPFQGGGDSLGTPLPGVKTPGYGNERPSGAWVSQNNQPGANALLFFGYPPFSAKMEGVNIVFLIVRKAYNSLSMKLSRYPILFPFLLLFFILAPNPLPAARYPDAVFKTFFFKTEVAAQVEDFLGLAAGKGEYRYPLGKMMAHAKEISPDGDARSAPEDGKVLVSEKNELSFVGVFLDQTTGSNPDRPRFTVESPFVAEGSVPDNGWGLIVKRWSGELQPLQTRKWGRLLLDKTLSVHRHPTLYLRVYQMSERQGSTEVWGYKVVIGVDPGVGG